MTAARHAKYDGTGPFFLHCTQRILTCYYPRCRHPLHRHPHRHRTRRVVLHNFPLTFPEGKTDKMYAAIVSLDRLNASTVLTHLRGTLLSAVVAELVRLWLARLAFF